MFLSPDVLARPGKAQGDGIGLAFAPPIPRLKELAGSRTSQRAECRHEVCLPGVPLPVSLFAGPLNRFDEWRRRECRRHAPQHVSADFLAVLILEAGCQRGYGALRHLQEHPDGLVEFFGGPLLKGLHRNGDIVRHRRTSWKDADRSEQRRDQERSALFSRNAPSPSARTAVWSSAWVFMTIGPYHATGSRSGCPEQSRKRMPS